MTIQVIEAKMQEAKDNPSKLVKVCAGYYFMMTAQGLAEIDHVEAKYDDTDWSGWVAKAHNRAWYNDPRRTLGEVVEELKAMS